MAFLKKLAFAALASVVVHAVAFADGYQYDFAHAFSGTAPASATTPWVQARFIDIAPGTVQLTVSNLNLSGQENVDQLYFNLAPTLDPTKLNFTHVSDSGSLTCRPLVKALIHLRRMATGNMTFC